MVSRARSVVVDTNVLVYALDHREPLKREIARRVLKRLLDAGAMVVTTQVLGEFYRCLTRQAKLALLARDALEHVRELMQVVPVLDTTAEVLEVALRGVESHRMDIFDAQIWAAASVAGIPLVLTEDCDDGLVIEEVRFVNPFADGFDIEALLR
jgi:predicted nucleic acid-binding protein